MYFNVFAHIRLLESLGNEDENVNENIKNNRFHFRIQCLHVEMQPSGHFLAVVSRNRTWKAQFLRFAENVNNRVRIMSIFMQL